MDKFEQLIHDVTEMSELVTGIKLLKTTKALVFVKPVQPIINVLQMPMKNFFV